MAESNVDKVRDVFERWNGGDFEVREEDTHPEIEVITQTSRFQGEPYRGTEGVRRWIAETLESFEAWELRLDEVQAIGDRVLGVGRIHLRGRGSGVDIDAPCAWIFDFRGGRCTRFETFLNRVDDARALAQARPTRSMPSGDRDVVQRLIDHWEVGEFAPALTHLHPDVVVVNQVSGHGFEGLGGIRRLIGDWEQSFSEWSLKVEELLDCPDGGHLVVGRIASTGTKTGSELDRPVGLLFGLQDGLIVRIDAFVNRLDEAYVAAGLERPA